MRFEDKYVLSLSDGVENTFDFSRYGFEKLYDNRVVNSIYFDDHAFSCFAENLEGNANRTKIRVRWYGTDSLSSAAKINLEIKWKESGIGGKCIIEVPQTLTEQHVCKRLTDYLRNCSIEKKSHEVGKALTMLLVQRDVIKIRYSRQYFFSQMLNCRLTVDNNISAFPLCDEFRAYRRSIYADFRVVELKYDTENAYSCRQYANTLRVARRSFSKYSWGLSNFNGQILANV
jgi:hypothetical protein